MDKYLQVILIIVGGNGDDQGIRDNDELSAGAGTRKRREGQERASLACMRLEQNKRRICRVTHHISSTLEQYISVSVEQQRCNK